MLSIFKAIKDNDLQLLNCFIDSSNGDHNKQQNQYTKKLQQQTKAAGVKNFDINARSVNGRTPLHIAVTWNRVDMVKALVNCQQVNVNLRDRENGWTALHRSLYMGNIEITRMLLARDDIDTTIKDWEGLTPFDLYDTTIKDTLPKKRILAKGEQLEEGDGLMTIDQHSESAKKNIKTGGTELYTWGYNTNYVLGHADSENRLKPERVKLQLESQRSPYFMNRPNYLIQHIAMSKYHMAVLTSDATNNVLMCGFGRGGRLGLGREADTQFIPVPVQWPEHIISIALGRDHTLAVTENGNVISFGNNSFGQLGYETENNHNKDEGPMQPLPRKIQAQSLKKQSIIGAAASRIHSVVYTANDIFTFGYNQGQLGYQQPELNDNRQTTPRKVSMSTEIQQVVANDNATVILNKSHEIILLCNYNQQRFFLPPKKIPDNIVVHRSQPNYPIKLLTSGTEYLGAVANTGDVYIWTCRSKQVKNVDPFAASNNNHMAKKSVCSTPSKIPTVISTPKCIWTSNKSHMEALDASLGQHGEIMICTRSGHVYIGRPDSNGYKFNKVPYLQRCIEVCANSSGAFAAIRSEYMIPTPEKTIPFTLKKDLLLSLPHIDAQKQLENNINTLKPELDLDLENERLKYMHYGVEDPDFVEHRIKQQGAIRRRYDSKVITHVEKAWERIKDIALQDKTLDVVFSINGRNIYCHSYMLQSRKFCKFNQLENRSKNSVIKVKSSSNGNQTQIKIEDCDLTAVLLLLDYVYTDEYQHPMKLNFELPPLSLNGMKKLATSHQVKKIQKDLVSLAEICQLSELLSSAQSSFSHQPIPTLIDHLGDLLTREDSSNIYIINKDKQNMKSHEMILRQRCSFFKNMLQPNSVWIANRKQQGRDVSIDLGHMSLEILKTIIDFIYLEQDGKTLFNSVERDQEESMLHYLLSFLAEADFLLLDSLKLITEKVLIRFVNIRSAITIYEHASNHLANELKHACIQFLTVNLPVFLSSSALDQLSSEEVRDLETHVRNHQIECMPLVERGGFNFEEDLSLIVEDVEFSTSIFASKRGDGSIKNFDEVLVTYYPQKHDQAPKENSAEGGNSNFTQDAEDSHSASSHVSKSEAGSSNSKFKRGIKVSLTDLESELNNLPAQQRRKSSVNWATPLPDTISDSTPKFSLREMIETESHPLDSTAKSLKAVSVKKISQKERRRLAQKQEMVAVVESSSSKPVWGTIPVVNAKPIMKIAEEASYSTQEPVADRKGKKIYVREEEVEEIKPREIEKTKNHILFDPVDSFGSSFNVTPMRRLNLNNNNTSPNAAKRSFHKIQKQQELEDNWLKGEKLKKNILRIQVEEQALESINQFYIQTLEIMSGEWCEVKRKVIV